MATNNSNGYTTSRLLTNSNNIRNTLATRNLYTPDVEYPNTNQTTVNKTVEAVSSVIGTVTPFKSFNLKNTVFGRLITDSTPLTEIGLVMLGRQFALNAMSHLSQQVLPIVKLSNLFDGSKDTKLFTRRIDLRITKKEDDTNFDNFLDKVVYYYPAKDNPFNKNSKNSDFIRNSGTGQLNFLYSSINRNIYKQNDSTLTEFGNVAKNPIQPRGNITDNRIFFNFSDALAYPYMTKHPNPLAGEIANKNMSISYSSTASNGQEYAPNADFINTNFGTTNKTHIYDEGVKGSFNDWIDTNTEFVNDNIQNKLVWGRDGVEKNANEKLAQLHGDTEREVNNLNNPETLTTFKIRGGLLEYTRNLLNATEGQVGDITRKAFRSGDKLVGFNGSGLWRANDSKYSTYGGTALKQGVRQHSVLDQYDRFAKAIRFNGNKVYGGNPNSVIYDSVLPRIHPTLDKIENKDVLNNKNLMFSIENLAVGVISKGDYGIIDDEFGSPIPLCEVGPFNGRIMWFPPYNMEINEIATAKFESTVMVGRNEPMYNYVNSERSGTLTFTLIVDYPQQLKNYRGQNKQKAIAEFFAFGGNNNAPDLISTVTNLEKKQQDLLNDISKIGGKKEIAEPQIIKPQDIKVVFPNDVPRIDDNVNTIIDDMYLKYHYEIIDSCFSSDGTKFGLNRNIYFVTGLTAQPGSNIFVLNDPVITGGSFSQYNQGGLRDQFGDCLLNQKLKEIFGNEDIRPYYSVFVYGSASKLFTELNPNDVAAATAHNLALGKRRADAVINLVRKRLEAIFGKNIADGIEVTYFGTGTIGDTQSSDDNATKVAIPEEDTKNERYAMIKIQRNTKPIESKEVKLTPNEETTVQQKQNEIQTLQNKINEIKSLQNDCVYNERTGAQSNGVEDAAILGGFKSVSGNYYYPVFHTQTPEDFHKRLTFLNQCTRQGAAKRFSTADADGNLTARNSVFGRQPICILRIGDFFYTKVIIESVNVDYHDTTWDMNPEGFGMQPMIANVTLQMKIIGGQSLKGPIDALQNAVSYNYYANSTFTNTGSYALPSKVADDQESYMKGILASKVKNIGTAFDELQNKKTEK